jgi:CPA2 family monovalent cation:H+ antiporter-2
MLLDPAFLVEHIEQVVLLVVVVGVGKGVIFAVLAKLFRYGNVIPLAVGLGLFQVGEFSFVLARVGVSTGSIGDDIYSLVLTTAVLTMAVTPLISGQTGRLYSLKKRLFRHEPLERVNIPSEGLRGHVVIAGGGRVGAQIAGVLQQMGVPLVVVELDHRRVEQRREEGKPVVYGDASHEVVLEAAEVGLARLLVVTTPDMVVAQAIIEKAHRANAGLPVVARTSDPGFLPIFKEMGVTEVVLPEFEAGLEMTRQALLHLRVPAPEIQQRTESLRSALFAPFFDAGGGYRTLSQLRSAEQQFDLQWVHLPDDSPLAGRTIVESDVRKTTGTSVVGVIRTGTLEANPPPDFRFAGGDLVAIIGTDAARQAFLELAAPSGLVAAGT